MGLDPVEFRATIASGTSSIKIDGDAGNGGKVTLEVHGTEDLAQLLKLVLFRGRRLRIRVEDITGRE